MDSPAAPVDASRCPLCGALNRCAVEAAAASGQPQPVCWCTGVVFDRDLLATLPGAARGLACLCSACATAGKPA